jgi:carboxyl-terminal processing protease
MPDQLVAQEPITYEEIGTEKDSQYQTAIQFLNQKTVLAKAS